MGAARWVVAASAFGLCGDSAEALARMITVEG
jgi:hypothetical protein